MKLGSGVIGTGLMGSMHANIYSTLPNCKLVAVADPAEENLRKVTQELGIKGYKSYEKMLEDEPEIKLVSICTPDKTHLEVAEYAIKRGKNLLIEKPLGRTVEDTKKIIKLAEDYKIKFLTAHLLRFDASYAQAYQAVKAGEIGEIVHIYTRRNDIINDARRLGGRTTLPFYLGVHDYDLINWFVQDELESVYSVSNSKVLRELNVNDSVFATFKYKNGTIACWEGSWIMPESIGKSDMAMEIVGTKGVIYIDAYNTGLRIHKDNFEMLDTMYGAKYRGKVFGALREQLIHFVDCVTNDKETLISGADALEAVRMAHAVEESLAKRNVILMTDDR